MLRIVVSNVDTLTESCEGAVNFMVIEMKDRSLHQFHVWRCSWISSACGLRGLKDRWVVQALFAFTEAEDHQTWNGGLPSNIG